MAMRRQLGSPGRAGSSRVVQVRHASHRSPAPRATSEQAAYEPNDTDLLVNASSTAARDVVPRYPALDMDAQTQQQLSRPVEQPRLRVGATDEDTEASCLCGPQAEEGSPPAPPPNKFNPVPIVATAASVPVLANWYTTNPATNPTEANTADEPVPVVSNEPSEAVGAKLTETEGSPLPNSDDGVPVDLTIEIPKVSEEVAIVGEAPAVAESSAAASADMGTAEVIVSPPAADEQIDTQSKSEAATEAPAAQTSEEKSQVTVEQPVAEPVSVPNTEEVFVPNPEEMSVPNAEVFVPNPEELPSQLVSHTAVHAPRPPLAVSNAVLAKPSQQHIAKLMPASITQGNEVQGSSSGADGRYPAFKVDASFDMQYAATPSTPNYLPRPGAQRSANCDAAAPGTVIDPSTLPGNNSQMNVTSSPGRDYSAYYNPPETQAPQYQSQQYQSPQYQSQQYQSQQYQSQPYQSPQYQSPQYQSRGQQQMNPYDMSQQGGGSGLLSQRSDAPETVAPPANPMPLAQPYSGSGSYGAPSPGHKSSETDPWGILERPGAYGMPQGLLHIDGGGGGGTYGAFSYGPPTQGQTYAAPPANTQEGYKSYSQAPSLQSQQQYYAQPPQQPQQYSQRGGGQQSYQGAPAEGYYYPPAGAPPPPPAQRRRAPEPQYVAPPPQGSNYTYQASPAGSMQDPSTYAGQYGGNQAYGGGNQPYAGGGNQAHAPPPGNQGYGGNQAYAPAQYGNQQYGNQQYGNQQYGNQQYGNQQYGNQQYSAPPARGGNYAPPAETTSQSSYPGIELLSPGYAEYDRGHKNASQQKPAAPPSDAYYPGLDSTYSAYGMKAPTAPTSNPPPQAEYSNSQSAQSYGYSYYTSPSNYQRQAQTGESAGGGPVAGYSQAPSAPAPESSYNPGYYYQGPNGGGYYSPQPAPAPRVYGQWPTADSTEAKEAATLILPVDDALDLNLPVTRVSGPVTSDIQALQSSLSAQRSLHKASQRHMPIATLPAPSPVESLSGIASMPPPSLDIGLLAAAFCCMVAAKGSSGNTDL